MEWKQRITAVMEISDPRKAMVEMARLVHLQNLDLTILEQAMHEYAIKHDIELDEMTFYPNGENVLTPDLFL